MNTYRFPQPLVTLRLLGSWESQRAGNMVHLETVKTVALLAYLALQHSPQPRHKLMGLLWGDLPEPRARRNLRHALWNIRVQFDCPAYPPLILCSQQDIAFNRHASYWLDVEEFEKVTSPSPHAVSLGELQAHIEVYRGDLLEGLYVDGAPEFEEWLLAERERFRILARDGLRRIIALALAQGEYTTGLDYARRLLAMDPWMEEGHRQVMRLLALTGQHSAALVQYETCCRILREELGVAPSSETTALYKWLVESRITRETPVNNLPVPPSSFIGREREVSWVTRLIKPSTCPSRENPVHRLVTLTGVGGCGKTRLALQVANSLVDQFKDGVWWIDLAPLRDACLVPQAIANALGIRESPHQTLKEVLGNFLRPRHILLVMDNCEHLVEACALIIAELLSACPYLTILATSRERLNIAGETTWSVPPLSFPRFQAELPQWMNFESIRLFQERAQAMKPDFTLTERNVSSVIQICRRLDGIPLAIELAAARVQVLSVEQIAARLDDCFNLLTDGHRAELPRHRTLRATMDWSHDLLGDAERVLFRRLSVFVGGWTLEAAEQVCTGEALDKSKLDANRVSKATPLDTLSHLVDKSLIVADEQDGTVRFRFLETIRQYAYTKLIESGEINAIQRCHLNYFLSLAEEGQEETGATEQASRFNRLEIEHDNLRSALRYAMENRIPTVGLRLATALAEFWERHGYLTEGSEWFGGMLAQLDGTPVPLKAKALVCAGKLEWTHGHYVRAITLADEGLALYRQLGDTQGIAWALHVLGGVMHYQGNHQGASELLQESLALFRGIENKSGIATTLLWLACARLRQGDTEHALLCFEECLSLFRQLGDKWGTGFALGGLGDTIRLQGDYARAKILLGESLILHWEQGNKSSITFVLEALAATAVALGQPEQAAMLWGAANALHVSIGTPIPPAYDTDYPRYRLNTHAQLGERVFTEYWAKGQAMSLEQVIELALR